MADVNWDQYIKEGYQIHRKFFAKDEVASVLMDAKRVFINQFVERGFIDHSAIEKLTELEFNESLYRLFQEDQVGLMNCGKQIQHLISLHRLSLQPKVEDLLRRTGLRFPNISTRPVLFFNHHRLAVKKIHHKVDPHQDWRSMQGSLNSVVIWVPLVDVKKELGALEVIPGSHLTGLRTDHVEGGFGMVDVSEAERFISVELEQGDVLVFSSFLIHQSGENVTDRPRWSCHFRYNDLAEETFVKRNYPHPYIYKPGVDLLTPQFPTVEQIRTTFA